MFRFLTLALALALAPLAQAETYTACLTFHDDRTFFPGDEARSVQSQGVPGLAVEFLITTAVGTWVVRPTALTGDDGCVSIEREDILFTLLATRFQARFLFDTDVVQIRADESREVGTLMSPSVAIGAVSHQRIGRVEDDMDGLASVWRTVVEGLEAAECETPASLEERRRRPRYVVCPRERVDDRDLVGFFRLQAEQLAIAVFSVVHELGDPVLGN